jgi:hypothetical protein
VAFLSDVIAMRARNVIPIIVIICLMVSFAAALTVKSEPKKEEMDERMLSSSSSAGTKPAPPLVTVSEGLSGRETVRYETSPGDPVQIQKIVLPGNKKKYTKDDMLRICVEIKGNANINGLNLHEFVSDGYSIVNISLCYKIYNLEDLDRYRDSLYVSSNQFSGDDDGIITLTLTNWGIH